MEKLYLLDMQEFAEIDSNPINLGLYTTLEKAKEQVKQFNPIIYDQEYIVEEPLAYAIPRLELYLDSSIKFKTKIDYEEMKREASFGLRKNYYFHIYEIVVDQDIENKDQNAKLVYNAIVKLNVDDQFKFYYEVT